MKVSIAASILAAVLLMTGLAVADHHEPHGLHIDGAFARASASPAVPTGAVYLTIRNHEDVASRLIGVETEASDRAELHTHMMHDGAMMMMEIEGGVEIPAGGEAIFEPGEDHIMLMGLAAPLTEGESLMLTLIFEDSDPIMVQVPILGVGAMDAGMDHDHSGHDHSGHDHSDHSEDDHSGHDHSDHSD